MAQRPALKLGERHAEGIAASIYALLERGIQQRPELARDMRGHVELRFEEDIEPVRIAFEETEIHVADGGWDESDLVITGRLPHIVHLSTAPTLGGLPNPARRDGRIALSRLRRGDLRIEGDRALGRDLMRLLEI
jgi:ubiquinone biosynthesis protein UbiJ